MQAMSTRRLFIWLCCFLCVAVAPVAEAADSSVSGRIKGGVEATAGEQPWAVRLYETGTGSSYCGGSLINPRVVLTAAHCVEEETAASVTAVIGRTDLDDSSQGEIRAVQSIAIHPDYAGNDQLLNDLALLFLETESSMETIAMVGERDPKGLAGTGQLVASYGWGRTSESGPSSRVLRKVTTAVVAKADTSWGSSLNNTVVLTGDDSQSACSGDSGGPLAATDGGEPVLVGVVSGGQANCSTNDYPGVYTRVSSFRTWIDDEMAQGIPTVGEWGALALALGLAVGVVMARSRWSK